MNTILKGLFGNMPAAAAVLRRPPVWRATLTLLILPLLALTFTALIPIDADAKNTYKSGAEAGFTARGGDVNQTDTCGMCHFKWGGKDARGDFTLAVRLWDVFGLGLFVGGHFGTSTSMGHITVRPRRESIRKNACCGFSKRALTYKA